MVSFPPCKINLGLNITSKRPDGYHNITTCFYPVQWTDILEVVISNELLFTSSGIAIPGNPNDNLCLKAYHIIKEDFNIDPVKIHLHKIIPIGAGLGGGSSDAAHTLRLLNRIFELQLSNERLHDYAFRLGSDCAFFIQDKPMLGTGRGEILSDLELNLKGKYLVIVKPEIHISTAEAYAGVSPKEPAIALKDILGKKPTSAWKDLIRNDFETSIFKKYPSIEKIKETLYDIGATYASMSGSGSSIFAIYENPIDLKKTFANHMYWSGPLQRLT